MPKSVVLAGFDHVGGHEAAHEAGRGGFRLDERLGLGGLVALLVFLHYLDGAHEVIGRRLELHPAGFVVKEDYALAFEIAGCQIVLVADGVSGEPLAGPAAYLAIQSAAWSVIRQLGAARPWRRLDPAAVASRALRTAANGLSRIAAACRCATGLKTTLIVVVSARRAYGYACIGDGKGCTLRATRMEEDLLIP